MDDNELTKKAVEELLKEMGDSKVKDLPAERKKNPLGKPNKRFLGRTINSMMKHNKRQTDNNKRRCLRKLKELEAKQRKCGKKIKVGARKEYRTETSFEFISSDCEIIDHKEKRHEDIKKIKRKKRKTRQKSSSSSSSSSSTSCNGSASESSGCTQPSKVEKHKKPKAKKLSIYVNESENEEDINPQVTTDPNVGYYIDPHMAYAAMAYGHINQVLHLQMVQQQQIIKDELEESVEIPSDLSITSHQSESSLNISLHSSSAEEDENGILTFKLLSSDEEEKTPNVTKINEHIELVNLEESDDSNEGSGKISKQRNSNELIDVVTLEESDDSSEGSVKISKQRNSNELIDVVTLEESDESNEGSVKSCISLESTSPNYHKQSHDTISLSSSNSEHFDDLELIEEKTEVQNENIQSQTKTEEYKDRQISDVGVNGNINENEIILNTNDENKEEGDIIQTVEIKTPNQVTEAEKGEVDKSTKDSELLKIQNEIEPNKSLNIVKNHDDGNKNDGLPENSDKTTMVVLKE